MSWQVTARVAGAAAITAATPALPVEATDQILVTVEPGGTDKLVGIQPGAASAIRIVKWSRPVAMART